MKKKKTAAKRASTRKRKPTASSKTASIAVPFRKRGSFGPDATNVISENTFGDYPEQDLFKRMYET